MQHNLEQYAPFAALERVMLAAVKKGADRQELHEILRQHSLAAWQEVQQGRANPLERVVGQDARITRWIDPRELADAFLVGDYTGFAGPRALETAQRIRACIE